MCAMDLPIVCTLNEAQLRERRQVIIDAFANMHVGVTELEDGYAFTFPASSAMLRQISPRDARPIRPAPEDLSRDCYGHRQPRRTARIEPGVARGDDAPGNRARVRGVRRRSQQQERRTDRTQGATVLLQPPILRWQ